MRAVHCVVVLLLAPTRGLSLFPLLRDSQLPLSGKLVLLASPRAEAAPLAAALIGAGARPLWREGVVTEPLDESQLERLDEAILRLAEYDVLMLFNRHAVDAFATRGLMLSDSSSDMLQLMIRASGVRIAATGAAALHLATALGVPADVVPVDDTPAGLSSALAALGTVRAGSRVLVPCARLAAPLEEAPAERASLELLRADGAELDCVEAFSQRLAPVAGASLGSTSRERRAT